jgi:hypothetical protein
MRVDFHFYTIYASARAAGFKPDDAYIIAYASQYTDDEIREDKIYYEDGEVFDPFITGHAIFDPEAITERVCERVWVPFHFVPGSLGRGDEVMLARANGPFVQKVIGEFFEYDLRPDSLHMLGIILHVYADTWSHQNFMGMINDMNNISEVKVEGEEEGFIEHHLSELKEKVKEYLVPNLGHAQAGSIPDEPFRKWEYLDYNGMAQRVNNRERALDAAYHCYELQSRFLKQYPEFLHSEVIPWDSIKEEIDRLFSFSGELKDCATEWGEAISERKLGFGPEGKDINLIYDHSEWYSLAVNETFKPNEQGFLEKRYTKTDIFDTSDWKYFNQAAAFYWANLYGKIAEDEGLPIWGT